MDFKFKELIYVPNIIEYIRIYLIYTGLISQNVFYLFISNILDMFDGNIARLLNQTSKLGCFLDHFIDACYLLGIY